MLDINLITKQTEKIRQALLKRLPKDKIDLESIIKLDQRRCQLIKDCQELKSQRNKYSHIKPDKATIDQLKKISDKISDYDHLIAKIELELNDKLLELPNLPADGVPSGGKEKNLVINTSGRLPESNFKLRDHIELATSLGLIDYERAVKMSGNGFWAYTADGALLEWALLNYFIDFHRQNNYCFIIPPFLLTEQSAYTSGHLPKFRDDLYWTQDNLCLNATSEMMMGNFHRNEILNEADLPLKYFAFSTCFRREAGSYRKEERGMIRGHQFNKIELFQFTKPEDSWSAFDELLTITEKLVIGLGLHFRTSLLASEDTSAAMAKTVDVEVYIPSMGIYKEVSSVSNATDYQARRGCVRYKNRQTNKTEFVHTLNASGLATSRLLPAILEQNQLPDGSVMIPKVLRKFLQKDKLTVNN